MRLSSFFLFPLCYFLFGPIALSQDLPQGSSEVWREPLLPRELGMFTNRQAPDTPSANRASCIHLFRMPSAFGTDPLILDNAADPPVEEFDALASGGGDKDLFGNGRVQVAMGMDNPFFDFRRRGDPGGVGFYRLDSQVLLLDSGTTGLSLGMQAVTPAGLDADGVAGGPTVLSPNFGWFYEVSNGTAIQGFIGKNIHANSHWTEGSQRDIRYGLALQSLFPGLESGPNQAIHFFVQALGRYRCTCDYSPHTPGSLDLLPGIHWRLNANWWMSGGLLMPLSSPRFDNGSWQFRCSWQF